MPNPTYERVSDNDADEEFVDISSQISRVLPGSELVGRPPVYYEDGPFDPPSSEDDDEDRFLDKSGLHGVLDPDGFGDSEPGNGLRIGGGKVSTIRSVIPWSSYALHA
jgi:dipeptidyl aminopeptidase